MLDKFFDSVFMDLESLLVPQKCKKKKKKQSKKQNKTKQTKKKKKKTPAANIQPYWPKRIGQ